MYNIFKFEKSEKEYCPVMTPLARKEAMELIDWDIYKENKVDVNDNGEAMIVIGYWRPYEKDETQQKYVSYITMDTKEKEGIQHIYMLPLEDKTLMVMQTTTDLKGCSISDEKDQVKGCLLINGTCKEEPLDDSKESKKLHIKLAKDLALPPTKTLRVFSTTFFPGQRPKKRAKRTKKETGKTE